MAGDVDGPLEPGPRVAQGQVGGGEDEDPAVAVGHEKPVVGPDAKACRGAEDTLPAGRRGAGQHQLGLAVEPEADDTVSAGVRHVEAAAAVKGEARGSGVGG